MTVVDACHLPAVGQTGVVLLPGWPLRERQVTIFAQGGRDAWGTPRLLGGPWRAFI